MPYINGFIMALVAIAKTLAIFVGYTETKYDSDPLQINSTVDSADNLSNSLGGATAKAKELKKQLMGFDVLNVITTPSESSGGGGGGSAPTEIDPAILNALKEYDNLMSGVNMKANEIRDKIMDWLGFEKIINEETGEITWKLRDGETNLKKILNWMKIIGITIAGLFIAKKLIALISLFKDLWGIIKGFNSIFGKIGTNLGIIEKTGSKAGTTLIVNWTKFAKILGKASLVISGIVIAIKGVNDMLKTFQGIVKNSSTAQEDLNKNIGKGLISFGELAAAGALIGTAFAPGIGTAIGAVAGSLAAVAVASKGYKDAIQEIAEKNVFGNIVLNAKDLETVNQKITNSVFNMSDSYNQFSEKNSKLSEEFAKLADETENVLWKYKNLGEEFATSEEIYNSIKKTCDKSISIIEDTTNGTINLLLEEFKNSTIISKETQTNMINSLKNGGETRKKKVKEIEEKIYAIYSSSMEQNGKLREKELKEIEEYYEELALLTESQAEKNQLELNRIVEEGNNKNNSLSKESLEKYIKQVQDSYQTATKSIEENYNAQLETHKQAAYEEYKNVLANNGNKEEAIRKYNDTIKQLDLSAGVTRKIQISELNETISQMNETMLSEVAKSYVELNEKTETELTDTQKASKKQLKEILDAAGLSSVEIQKLAGKTARESYSEMNKNWGNLDVASKINFDTSKLDGIGKSAGKVLGGGLTSGISEKLTYSSFPSLRATLTDVNTGVQQVQSVLTLRPYATGGFPDIGQMFIAREAGAELVGTIGNKTAVVNNDQIVQSVSQGVAQAVSSVLGTQGGNYNFYIDGQQITDVITKRQNRNLSVMGV